MASAEGIEPADRLQNRLEPTAANDVQHRQQRPGRRHGAAFDFRHMLWFAGTAWLTLALSRSARISGPLRGTITGSLSSLRKSRNVRLRVKLASHRNRGWDEVWRLFSASERDLARAG
jgi:hypothetical protein